jgi:hypothetical protein
LKSQINSDVGKIISMSALTLSQLLENAQENGVILRLETSTIENQVVY